MPIPPKDIAIRPETPEDRPLVYSINQVAFGRSDEADLVDRLRLEGVVLLSLVALIQKQIVGHVLFSRMWIESTAGRIPAVALAPTAVLPEHQRHGIGSALVHCGLEWLQRPGERIVVVLGDPRYYSRFGFLSEKAKSLESPFKGPSFMALELTPHALQGVRGRVIYAAAFGLD